MKNLEGKKGRIIAASAKGNLSIEILTCISLTVNRPPIIQYMELSFLYKSNHVSSNPE